MKIVVKIIKALLVVMLTTVVIGIIAIKILSSRLNGKECSTVSHSGKWSVLEGKNPTRRKIK